MQIPTEKSGRKNKEKKSHLGFGVIIFLEFNSPTQADIFSFLFHVSTFQYIKKKTFTNCFQKRKEDVKNITFIVIF